MRYVGRDLLQIAARGATNAQSLPPHFPGWNDSSFLLALNKALPFHLSDTTHTGTEPM